MTLIVMFQRAQIHALGKMHGFRTLNILVPGL